MTTISGLSSNLIQSYERFQSVSRLTTENMFQMLSLEMDGDGEIITRDQLDTYVEDVKDGLVDVSNKELDALRELQKTWDDIAGKDSESINFKDMEEYNDILFSAVTGGISITDESSTADSAIEDIDSYLIEETLGRFINDTGSNATHLLQTLLAGPTGENDDSNADLIATLVNLIADSSSASTVEVEA